MPFKKKQSQRNQIVINKSHAYFQQQKCVKNTGLSE